MARLLPHLLAVLATSIATGCASTERVRHKAIPPDRIIAPRTVETDAISVDIPVGTLRIRNADDDRLSASMIIYCADTDDACARRAAAVELLLETDPAVWRVASSEPGRWYYREMDLESELWVPEGVNLDVRFGYGELDIEHRGGCLDVAMSAGEVQVRMPLSEVRSVYLDANAGDASLRADGKRVEGRRVWLVGAEVEWAEGPGPCKISVNLGAGDISVSLE